MKKHFIKVSLYFLISLFLICSPIIAQEFNPNFWTANGTVYSFQKKDSLLYLGGSFSYVGPTTGSLVAINSATNERLSALPQFNGSVRTIASDNNGGWYVGGTFTSVNGIAKGNLVHILPNLQLDLFWNVSFTANASYTVNSIVVKNNIIYFGGLFTKVNNVARRNLAAVNATTGQLLPWNPSPDKKVNSIIVLDDKIIVGGLFTTIGQKMHLNLGAVNTTDGAALSWSPVLAGALSEVRAIAGDNNTLYVGGKFSSVDGSPRVNMAAFNLSDLTLKDWRANADISGKGYVNTLLLSNDRLYIGGNFSSIESGTPNNTPAGFNDLGVVNKLTGDLITTWNPKLRNRTITTDEVNFITIKDDKLYAAGSFNQVGSSKRLRIACIDTVSGQATSWTNDCSHPANVIYFSGSKTFIGGNFTSLGGMEKNNLAAINVNTGKANQWSPYCHGIVYSMALYQNDIYVAGKFDTLGTKKKANLGFIPLNNDTPYDLNLSPNGLVKSILMKNDVLYIGGTFTSVAGAARKNLAAVNASTGALLPWQATINNAVNILAASEGNIYVGGAFTSIGGVSRNRLAELNATTAVPTSFDPNIGGAVYALLKKDKTLYVGGKFPSIGGVSGYNGIGAIDLEKNEALPNYLKKSTATSAIVYALANIDNTLFVGGAFTVMGARSRARLAILDCTTAVAFPWNPAPNSTIFAIATSGHEVYGGGAFTSISSTVRTGIANYQYSNPVSLVFSPSNILMPAAGGKVTIKIEANVNWSISTSASFLSSNFTVGANNGSIVVTIAANKGTARDGKIFIQSGSYVGEVKVFQNGISPTFSLSKSNLAFKDVGGDSSVTVTSNIEWSFVTEDSWITAQKVESSLNSPVTVSAYYNYGPARVGTITFIAGNTVKTLNISQDKGDYFLESDKSSISFLSAGADSLLSVNSNTSWTATSSHPWLLLDKTSGTNSKKITLTCGNNNAGALSATVTLKTSSGITKVIKVTQQGFTPTLSLSENNVLFNSIGGDKIINVISNTNWTVSNTAGWIVVDTQNGLGNQAVKLRVSENLEKSRFQVITFTSGNIVTNLTISQSEFEPRLNVSTNSITIPASGSENVVSILSNTSWKVSSQQDWITVDKSSGSMNEELKIVSDKNLSGSARTAFVLVSSGSISQMIEISQPAAIPLSVDRDTIYFTGDGGSGKVIITSDTQWQIFPSQSWITTDVTEGSDSKQVVVTVGASAFGRDGNIQVVTEESTKTIVILQKGSISPNLLVSTNALEFNSSGGDSTINIKSNISWNITTSSSWIILSKSNGSNDSEVKISVNKNIEVLEREGWITLSGSGLVRIIRITQKGAEVIKKYNTAKVYPNPISSFLFVTLELKEAGLVKMRMFNLLGEEVKFISAELPEGKNIIKIEDLDSLPKGFFFLTVEFEHFKYVKELIKE